MFDVSISNIAWTQKDDVAVYALMKQYRYSGLEIAPTRIFPEAPYDRLAEAKIWAESLEKKHGFTVSSMQSIWFGRQEKMFGTAEERQILLGYTKKAIEFATAIGCKNLVFGCPRNRYLPEGADENLALSFFQELGDYAYSCGTTLAMEANPTIYNTNYINDTKSALRLIEKVNSKGFLLNLDVGTMIQNNENLNILLGKVSLINHVHISEPGLKPIEGRKLHLKLKELLEKEGYDRYISIEMGRVDDITMLEQILKYAKEIFNR